MVIRGYVGGDDEALLIAALKECIEQECADAWDKVETESVSIGSVIETAIGLGYIKKSGMTFAGYVNKHVGYGEKTARDCLRSWEKRHDFAEVKAWVLHGNTGYKPPKATGPLLYLDAHKAWSNRLKPNRPPPTPKLTLKDARTMLMVYRDILDSVGAEHLQLAQYADREPRAWLAGAQRRMEIEARFSELTGSPAAPYHAKRPDKLDEEVVEDVIEPEPEPEPEPVTVTPEPEPVTPEPEPITPEPEPITPEPEPVTPEPDVPHPVRYPGTGLVVTLPNPSTLVLDGDMAAATVFDIETANDLRPWSGPPGKRDAECHSKRASFFSQWGAYLNNTQRTIALSRPRKFWLGVSTVADVLNIPVATAAAICHFVVRKSAAQIFLRGRNGCRCCDAKVENCRPTVG